MRVPNYAGPGGAVYSYTAPQANGDGPVTGGGGGGAALSADDFSEPTANGTYQSMATGVCGRSYPEGCRLVGHYSLAWCVHIGIRMVTPLKIVPHAILQVHCSR